eukprot:354898-Chlamydomonas_euryale.AAC.2
MLLCAVLLRHAGGIRNRVAMAAHRSQRLALLRRHTMRHAAADRADRPTAYTPELATRAALQI